MKIRTPTMAAFFALAVSSVCVCGRQTMPRGPSVCAVVSDRLLAPDVLMGLAPQKGRVVNIASLAPDTRTICLAQGNVCDAQLMALDRFTKLERLNLRNTPVTDVGLFSLRNRTTLRELRLSDTQITNEGVAHLAKMRKLTLLELDGTAIGDLGVAQIAELDRLAVLVLDRTGITDVGLRHLSTLTNLEELSLAHTRVTDGGLAYLATMPKLRVLHLNDCQIRGAGFASARTSRIRKGWPQVRKLYLRCCPVSNEGVLALTRCCPWLTSLDLSYTDVSRVGCLVHLSTLTELNLSHTAVTDAGIRGLGALTHLRSLNLSDTRVTDACIGQFSKLNNLRWLNLQHTSVTAAAILKLQQAIPTLATDRDVYLGSNGGLLVRDTANGPG